MAGEISFFPRGIEALTTIYFAHGKESGPAGRKIRQLSRIGEQKGFLIKSPDFRGILSPDARCDFLLQQIGNPDSPVILVGSSMGAYVVTSVSEKIQPLGLFLMAPAFYLPGYENQNPTPCSKKVVLIHGWLDEVVPVSHALRFAMRYKTETHLLAAGHSLEESLPFVEQIFSIFLDGLS